MGKIQSSNLTKTCANSEVIASESAENSAGEDSITPKNPAKTPGTQGFFGRFVAWIMHFFSHSTSVDNGRKTFIDNSLNNQKTTAWGATKILHLKNNACTPNAPHLKRFIEAQNKIYDQVCQELDNGQKKTHWMWYIFPQIAGLGQSEIAKKYAIANIKEAQEYLNDPILGPRLRDCFKRILKHSNSTAEKILGPVDSAKLHSSATLFLQASDNGQLFQDILDIFYRSTPDSATLKILKA